MTAGAPTTGTGVDAIPGTVATIAGGGIERGLHLGGQLSVSLAGEPVADLGIGEARAGVSMTPESMVTWFSMTKPSVAVAVAQQWERGNLEIDDRVADHIPRVRPAGQAGSHCAISSPTPRASVRPISSRATRPATPIGRRSSRRSAASSPKTAGCRGAGRIPPHGRHDAARRGRAPCRRPSIRALRARGDLRAARHGRLLGRHARRRARGLRSTHRHHAPHRHWCRRAARRARRARVHGAFASRVAAGAAPCASSPASTRCCSAG